MSNTSEGRSVMVQGRIVWAINNDLFKGGVKKDFHTKQPKIDQNGQQVMEYGFGLAVPKMNPDGQTQSQQYLNIWNELHQEAYTIYPDGQLPQGFSLKNIDGDTAVDKDGQPYNKREGYAGHLVFTCTTQMPIKFCRVEYVMEGGEQKPVYVQINEGIKVGDYVYVQLNIRAHAGANPGVYLNPNFVQLIQPGKEIVKTASPEQVFGAAPVTQYDGAVVAPTTAAPFPGAQAPPAAAPAPGAAPQAVQPPAPAMPGQTMPAATQPAQAPVQPHYQVLPPQHQPAAPQVAAPAPGNAPAPATPGIPVMPGQTYQQ